MGAEKDYRELGEGRHSGHEARGDQWGRAYLSAEGNSQLEVASNAAYPSM